MPRSGLSARHWLSALSVVALVITTFSPITFTQATAAPALVTCVNLQTGTERISHTGKCRYSQEAQANWHKNQSDSPIASGPTAKVINICSNKESSTVSYQVIRKKCARHQVATIFSRSGSLPAKPVIVEAVSYGHDSASLKLAADPSTNIDAPIAFYTISATKVDTSTSTTFETQRIYYWKDLSLAINTLQASTRYTFTVTATTADGTSAFSALSNQVTTPAYVAPQSSSSSSTLTAPAFTLSSSSETRVATTSLVGYSISTTGGAVTSYAISGGTLPAGLTFSTSTGLITGTPTETKTATTYTITGTNSVGSASATYRLRVTGDIGDIGPGGGKIFYYLAGGFNCGITFTSTCRYLEVAQNGWNSGTDPSIKWAITANVSTSVPGITSQNPAVNDPTEVGLGYKYSVAIVNQGNDATTAAGAARAYAGGSQNDWYLPTTSELNLLCQWNRGVAQNASVRCSGGTLNAGTGASDSGFISDYYQSSSQLNASLNWVQQFGTVNGTGSQGGGNKSSTYLVRPIRAF
jgi:hypothetical protein